LTTLGQVTRPRFVMELNGTHANRKKHRKKRATLSFRISLADLEPNALIRVIEACSISPIEGSTCLMRNAAYNRATQLAF
jgi:hypothetical protein